MLQTEHVEERLALSYVLALENRDLLKELTKPDQWVISEDLKVRYTTLSSHSPHWQPNIMISEKHFGLHESIFTVTNSQCIQRECLGSCLVSAAVFVSHQSLTLSQKEMNSLNVSGLPAENEVMQVKELPSAIGSALTTFRNTMKTKVRF